MPAEEAGVQPEYRLHAGDQVELKVYREQELSGIFQVDAAGLLRHPLCGSFPAAGLTVAEAEAGFTELLREKYMVNPRVLISVVSAQSSHVVILGEINNPGVHAVPVGRTMTLLQAIAEAGGFSDLASVDRVTVTRSEDGKEKSIRVRVSRMIAGQEPDLELKPNDVIMVPEIRF
jgi:polysaccharide export outer membrane protein